MKCYTGNINNLCVRNISFNNGVANIVTESIVIKKDAPFYMNIFGKLVSLDYNTFLATGWEADSFVRAAAEKHPYCLEEATCLYADYDNMKVHEISRKEFKQLKKTCKQQRRI